MTPSPQPAVLDDYREADRRYLTDREAYCRDLVKIAPKEGGVLVPFRWNAAQRKLNAILDRQLEVRGWVRALILKARQLGISTYIGARYYHSTSLSLGTQTYILTHEDKATSQLFRMVRRMHDHMPVDYRPEMVTANANEIQFAGTNSGYRVGTAKNVQGGGRSLTIHRFHGSETAFWSHPEDHFAAALQAVPGAPGTEIILESTANGVGGTFYDQWQAAERGDSDFAGIFLPWFIADEYRRAVEPYDQSPEEREYQELYRLDDEQACWLHFKSIDLGGNPGEICTKFRQEYPATAAEAFQASSGNSLIGDEYILAARRCVAPDQSYLPRVIGMDVARSLKDARDKNGKLLKRDATRIVDRQGRKMGAINECHYSDDPVFLASRLMALLRDNPDIRKAFVDATEGMGAGIVTICRGNGFEGRVVGVNFGSAPQNPERYLNRRGEMHGRLRDWCKDAAVPDIPDDDLWHRHMAATTFKYDANGRLVLDSKEHIRKEYGFSPDIADAGALTFAELLAVEIRDDRPKWMRDDDAYADTGGGWITL